MAKSFNGLDDEWLKKASKHYLEIAYEGVLQGLAGNHTLKETLERRMKEVDEKERLAEERRLLAEEADDAFCRVFYNFCFAYFIEADLDIDYNGRRTFAFNSCEWDDNDLETFVALVGPTKFEDTNRYNDDAYVPFEVNLCGGFFNNLLGIDKIVLLGYFDTYGENSRSEKVAAIDIRLSSETSELITKEHMTMLRYIADQTEVFGEDTKAMPHEAYVALNRKMRKVIIEDGLKEIVEGTLTKEDFEQKLFLAKLAGF